MGNMSFVALMSAVLAAVIPVVVTAFTEGLSRQIQLPG